MRKHTDQLKLRLGEQESRLNNLSFYGRCIALAVGLVLILGLWHLFLFRPLQKTKANLQVKVSLTKKESATLKSKITLLKNQISGHSNDKDQLSLRTKINNLNETINVFSGEFIPEKKMDDVFRAILAKEKSLKLLSIRMGKVVPIKTTDGRSLKGDTARVYERGMTLKFKGGYLATLKFLKGVEGLKWQIFWDRLTYSVDTYPDATVSITIHTLAEKGEKS